MHRINASKSGNVWVGAGLGNFVPTRTALVPPERRLPPAGCSRMETAKDYCKFAQECRQLAKRAGTDQHKFILEEMAEVWLKLAAEAEQKMTKKKD
jgi:hypothetical protein